MGYSKDSSKSQIYSNTILLSYTILLLSFSRSVVFNSLQPHGLQHARLRCPSSSSRTCSNPYSLSQWCHPIIWSSVIPFHTYLQTFPASMSFPMSQFFTSDGQSIGASALVSVLPMNMQELISFRMDWVGLLAVQGTLKSLLQHHSSKGQFFGVQPSLRSNSHIPLMTTGKTIASTIWTFVSKVMSLLLIQS